MSANSIEEVLAAHTDEWMSVPGVVGTAIGESEGRPCILVLVVERTDEVEESIPDSADGFAVVVVESGEIEAREPDEQ